MNYVNAVVVQGHQVASGRSSEDRRFPGGTIRAQAPHFAARGCDLAAEIGPTVFFGTLNLAIVGAVVRIAKPEYVFQQVKWTDVFPPENFFLSPANVGFEGRKHRALLYIPDPVTKPDHAQASNVLEVIAEAVLGIVYGSRVVLGYNPCAIELSPP
jgi:hypothetical protein